MGPEPEGIWSLKLTWTGDDEDIVVKNLKCFDDLNTILAKYRGYSTIDIKLRPFTDTKNW